MQTQYQRGKYEMKREDGQTVTLELTKNEAKVLFKLSSKLGFYSIEKISN